MSENVKRFYRGFTYMGVILFSGFIVFKYFTLKNQLTKTINYYNQEIIKKDTIIKIGEVKYNKLIKVYKTTKSLNENIEKHNRFLYDTIKKRNEKIMSITHNYVTFMSKHGSVTELVPTNKADTAFNFVSYYPNKDNYMAKFTGNVNTKTKKVGENWDFQKFKLGIVLTQKSNGMWDYYLDAPEYAVISDLKIKSLPPIQNAPVVPKKIEYLVGLGVRANVKGFDNKSVVLSGGIRLKNDDVITADLSSKNYVGVGYLIRVK